jgi:hypothetical protein
MANATRDGVTWRRAIYDALILENVQLGTEIVVDCWQETQRLSTAALWKIRIEIQ